MAIIQAVCNSFKRELFEGVHNFKLSGGDTFKMSLYSSAASLDKTTTAYTATSEVPNGSGYTTGGNTLTRIDPALSGDTAVVDFADTSWSSATFTARGALIYNSTDSNAAVVVLDFGSDRSVSSGTFTIVFPTADASNAIIRLA